MSNGNSIGIPGLVFVVLLALKLAGIGVVAGWSWWWVTAPLWLPAACLLAIAVFCIGMATLNGLVRR